MRWKGRILLLCSVLFLLLVHLCHAQNEKAKGADDENDKKEEEEEEEEEDYDPLPEEEDLGPFQLRKLNYVVVQDDSEPHYFELVGARRLASIKSVRSAFRRKAFDYREGLMRLYNRSSTETNATNATHATAY